MSCGVDGLGEGQAPAHRAGHGLFDEVTPGAWSASGPIGHPTSVVWSGTLWCRHRMTCRRSAWTGRLCTPPGQLIDLPVPVMLPPKVEAVTPTSAAEHAPEK